jgi:hypothetical protein
MTERNPLVQAKSASTTVTGVDTDGSGDVVVTVGGLRQIESSADVDAQAADGYVANVQSVDGNDVTVRIFESAGSAAALSAVTGGSGVTDLYVQAEGQ